MWPRFGIKIGNSTICLATSKEDGKVEVVANKNGNRVSHAVVLIDGNEVEVGLTAKQKITSKGSCSIVNNFQLFARNLSEVQLQHAVGYLTCQYNPVDDKYELRRPVQPGGDSGEMPPEEIQSVSPYDVCVELFKASFELARQCHILEAYPSVVLSIPIYYPQESWTMLAEAAEEAGFHVSQVIPEHTASLLAYEHLLQRSEARVLCIKSGGLLTSVSIFDIEDGLFSLKGSAGPFYIGGKQFTDVLKEFICTEFFKKYKLDAHESRRSMAKVQNAAEECKHILTTLPSTQIYIDSLMDGIDFNVQMSRARYEMLMQPVQNELLTVLSQAVESIVAKIETASEESSEKLIDEIVLVGGTMKIPKIQAAISSRFPNAKVNAHLPPDEVVAMGCATQSFHLTDPDKQDGCGIDTKTENEARCACIRDSIYVWRGDEKDEQQLVFEKGSLLPMETVIEFNSNKTYEDAANKEKETVQFHVQMANSIGHIELSGGGTTKTDGVHRVRAIVEETNGRPKISLANAT